MKRVLLAAVLTFISVDAMHACVSYHYTQGSASSISFYPAGGWSTAPPIGGALAMWECAGMPGVIFPALSEGTSGEITIGVTRINGANPEYGGGCGRFNHALDAQNRVTGGDIEVFTHTNAGDSCDWVLNDEYFLRHLIAHEAGHVLGLANSSCEGYLMGPTWYVSSVQQEECEQVAAFWTMDCEVPSGGGGEDPGGTDEDDVPSGGDDGGGGSGIPGGCVTCCYYGECYACGCT